MDPLDQVTQIRDADASALEASWKLRDLTRSVPDVERPRPDEVTAWRVVSEPGEGGWGL